MVINQSSVQGLQLRRDLASGRVKANGADGAKVTLFLEDGTQYPLAGKKVEIPGDNVAAIQWALEEEAKAAPKSAATS